MKKQLFSIVFALFGALFLSAQVTYGVKAGINFATVTGDFTEEAESRTGLHVGGFVEVPISERFSFQPELLYSMQGAKASVSETFEGIMLSQDVTRKQDYLNIPLMVKYYLIENLSIEAGPQVGFLLSAKGEVESSFNGESITEDIDFKDEASSIDFGFNLGAAYQLDMGLFFGARYNFGLSNINDNEDSGELSQQNAVFQLSVGYIF